MLSTGTATLVDWGALTTLIVAGLNYVTAVWVGALLGALTDYSIKRFWAFRSHESPLRWRPCAMGW